MEDVNRQLIHRTRELGRARAAQIVRQIHAKDAQFVAVQRQGLAPLRQILFGGFKIAERRLGVRKEQFPQTPGGIINEDQEHTGRGTLFKPGKGRTVYLHQFPEPGAALAQRMNHGALGAVRLPQARLDHQVTHGLHR